MGITASPPWMVNRTKRDEADRHPESPLLNHPGLFRFYPRAKNPFEFRVRIGAGRILGRMAGKWTAPPGWRAIRQQVFRVKGRRCFWCGGLATTVDHYPVPAALGGPHTLDNLIPSCARDNYSRGASFGNAMRAPRPLTAAQKRAIGLKRKTGATRMVAVRPMRSSRDW
jgi:hypothetical protein